MTGETIYSKVIRTECLRLSGTDYEIPTTPSRLSSQRPILQFHEKRKPDDYDSADHERFSSTPLSKSSRKIMATPQTAQRVIQKTPFKVLDAPELQDDFYLNLVDWSSKNTLGVGLGNCVYLWNAQTCKVEKLCDLGPDDSVTAVNWNPKGTHVAVGTNKGIVQLWDVHRQKCTQQYTGHESRVVCNLAWAKHANEIVSTHGYSQNQVVVWKVSNTPDKKPSIEEIEHLTGHTYRVLYLAMSPDGQNIVTGAGDETLRFWSVFAKGKLKESGRSLDFQVPPNNTR
ncbi:hypothetical protein HK101_011294 [Irineochytrium annulatum]|nr:hypothetical protein HK101_011294 [Irineochytrium annulatum]